MKPIWLKVAECPIREHHYQAAVQHVLRTGKVDQGEAVDRLEAEFARRLGVPRDWVMATQSCTAGMGLCFHFFGGEEEGGIGAPAITWPGSYCMGPKVQWYDMWPRDRGNVIVLVDLFGEGKIPEMVGELESDKTDAWLVVDAAHNVLDERHVELLKRCRLQAIVYSFGAVKQLSGIRGGMVVSQHINDKWRAARHYGVLHNRVPEYPRGGNFDMNDFSAALILSQYEEFVDSQRAAWKLFDRYVEKLAPLKEHGVKILERGSGHLFVIWTPKRDRLRDALLAEGIETSVHYKLPAWLQPFDYPRSREWANTVLTLPLHSRMGIAEVDRVCEVVVEQIGGAANRQAAGAASPEA